MLAEDFTRIDVLKARKVRDADADGFVYDNTPRQRPALPSEAAPKPRKPAVRAKAPVRPKGMAARTADPKNPRRYEVHGVDKNGKSVMQHAKDRDEAIDIAGRFKAEGMTNITAIPVAAAPPPSHSFDLSNDADLRRLAQDFKAGKVGADQVAAMFGAAKKPGDSRGLGERLRQAAGKPEGRDPYDGWPEHSKRKEAEKIKNKGVKNFTDEDFDNLAFLEPGVGWANAKMAHNQKKKDIKAPAGKPRPGDGVSSKRPVSPIASSPGPGSAALGEKPLVDYDGAELDTPAEQAAGEAWHRAQLAAAQGDEVGYRDQLDKFLDVEDANGGKVWGESIMDKVEGWFEDEDPKGTAVLNKAANNAKKWKAKASDVRSKRKSESDKGKPASNANDALSAHFAKGGGIGDAPPGDVLAYAKAHPERFDVMRLGEDGGVSPSYWVVDKKIDTEIEVEVLFKGQSIMTTNEVWFLKGNAFPDDVMAEVMVGDLLADAKLFPVQIDVKFANEPQAGDKYVAMPHVGQQDLAVWDDANQKAGFWGMGVIDVRKPVTKGSGGKPGQSLADLIKDGPDKGSFMRLATLDWIINNGGDRHMKNLIVTVDENAGVAVGPIDHGLAFWNGGRSNENLEDFMALGRPRGNFINALDILETREEVLQELTETAAKLKKTNWKKLIKSMEDRQPPLSDNQKTLMRKNYDEAARRSKWLADNLEEATDTIMKLKGARP